ncbi:hypothetical protein QQF64_018110 [Cirrhinus molitorella]|uniref:UPAR/Ly6 domain-containing protein n=1 Tax=Cirrhinus molitorella TaxID=172907 RepID=A0ABR3LKJ8_9TELE
MHLRGSIVLLLILLTGGFSLDCYECHNQLEGICRQSTCRSDHNMCASSKKLQYIAGIKVESIYKSCSVPLDCESWSISTGDFRRTYAVECCDTNFCNKQSAPDLSSLKNGKSCYTCDWEDCSKTLSCWGNEDYCFTTYETSSSDHSNPPLTYKGCVSKSACDRPGLLVGSNGNATCCLGNLCNGAQSVTQSFLFLCCSLLPFILLH